MALSGMYDCSFSILIPHSMSSLSLSHTVIVNRKFLRRFRDCKTEKCKRNGRECNLGSTCDFDEGERCFCDWNGEIKYV